MRIAYCVTTWSGAKLVETIHSVPQDSRLLVVDTSQHGWPLAKAWNYAEERLLHHEEYDYVIIMNDDIILKPETGQRLAEGLASRPDLLMSTGYNTQLTEDIGERWGEGECDFSCFCIDKRLRSIVGPFDEHFIPCYFEDNDMHRRIRLAGYEASSWTPYFHYGSVTYKTDAERRREVDDKFERNRSYYAAKWGGAPGQETFGIPFNGRFVSF